MKYKYRIVEETNAWGKKYYWPKRKRWFGWELINRAPDQGGILMGRSIDEAKKQLLEHIDSGEHRYKYTRNAGTCEPSEKVVFQNI